MREVLSLNGVILSEIKGRGLKLEQGLTELKRVILGDHKSVGEGVFELRIDCGSGYRIYFGQEGSTIIILLCGGDKSTQAQDIRKAQEYGGDYRSRDDA